MTERVPDITFHDVNMDSVLDIVTANEFAREMMVMNPFSQPRLWRVGRKRWFPGEQNLFAVNAGRIVGQVDYYNQSEFSKSFLPIGDKVTAHVDYVYVAPEYRRRGIGKAMLDAMIARMAGQGYSRATLVSYAPNDAATTLYNSAGWSEHARDESLNNISWNKSFNKAIQGFVHA